MAFTGSLAHRRGEGGHICGGGTRGCVLTGGWVGWGAVGAWDVAGPAPCPPQADRVQHSTRAKRKERDFFMGKAPLK